MSGAERDRARVEVGQPGAGEERRGHDAAERGADREQQRQRQPAAARGGDHDGDDDDDGVDRAEGVRRVEERWRPSAAGRRRPRARRVEYAAVRRRRAQQPSTTSSTPATASATSIGRRDGAGAVDEEPA